MAHSLASSRAPARPLSSAKATKSKPVIRSLPFPRVSACSSQCSGSCSANATIDRRSAALGLAGAVVGCSNLLVGDDISANAAGRRPPPAGPPAEKKDPNISGLAAKVLASKKRKEAMKEAIAKQRQQGKPAAVKLE